MTKLIKPPVIAFRLLGGFEVYEVIDTCNTNRNHLPKALAQLNADKPNQLDIIGSATPHIKSITLFYLSVKIILVYRLH